MDQYGTLQSEFSGIESIAVDPTDANSVYVAANLGRTLESNGDVTYHGEVLVSHNRGLSWSPLGLASQSPPVYMGPNDPYRGTAGERVAIDPQQPSTIFFASRKDGLWRGTLTSPTAANWTKVAGGLPSSVGAYSGTNVGMTFVVFDRGSGAAASGATKTLYLGLYNPGKTGGVMVSNDGGATWTDTKSSPGVSWGDAPQRAVVDSDSVLYVTFGLGSEGAGSGALGRYQGGNWTDISFTAANKVGRWAPGYGGVSVDPRAAGTLMLTTASGGGIYRSTDHGATWKQALAPNPALLNQPTYYAQAPLSWGAALAIDPKDSKGAWQTNGYGVIWTADATIAAPSWSWQMNSLEELCVQSVKAPPWVAPTAGPPAADLFSTSMDMVGFRHASRDGVPTSTIDQFPFVALGNGIAYCASQPQYVAFVGWVGDYHNPSPLSGISSDNGVTWKHFPNTTPGVAGSIAMSATDPNNMVWSPAGAGPQYSLDGGVTWKKCMTAGNAMSGSWQLSGSPFKNAEVLAPDLVAGGTFYYFDNGNFYVSTDNGATWTLTSSGLTAWALKSSIVPNPVQAGDIWMSFRPNSNQPTSFQLIRSTDGGKTFQAVPTVDQCNFVAFGKGNSATMPFIYIHGRANGDPNDAIYKSEDLAVTWIRVSEPRTNQFGNITALAADMRTQDLVYVALGCRGIQYGYGPKSGIAGSDRQPTGVLNIANQQSGAVAPGEMLTVTTSLPASAALQVNGVRDNGITGTELNLTQILFDGQPAPILATVAGEAVVTVPYGIAGQNSVSIQLYDQIYSVLLNSLASPLAQGSWSMSYARLSLPLSVSVAAAAPGIFAGLNGAGAVVAINADGQINSSSHPAAKGSAVTLYLTGSGVENQSVVDGRIASALLWAPAQSVEVQFGGIASASVTASAAPNSIAGITRVTAMVPGMAPSGAAVPLLVTVGGIASLAGVTVAVQ